jgi:hypothetical protein
MTRLNIFLLSVTATSGGILVGFDWMYFIPPLYKTKIKSLLIAWVVQTFPHLIIKYSKFQQQIKKTGNIIKSETGKKASNEAICMLNIDENITDNYQVISDSLNNHFSIDEKIRNNIHNNNNTDSNNSNPLDYLINFFKDPFPNMKFNYTSMKEV